MVKQSGNNTISCIFPIGEGCMISFVAADRLNRQLTKFYPRKHLSYVFEFRLTDHQNQVDFAMAMNQKEDLLFLKNEYQKVQQTVIADWLTDCSILIENNKTIKSYWIETDLNGKEKELIPSLFITPKYPEAKPTDFQQFFKALNFNQSDSNSEKLLSSCLNVLGTGQYIEHIGIMHSRDKDKTTRVYIKGLDQNTLIPFLNKINWPGDKEFLLMQFEGLPAIAYFTVAIEFNKKWHDTIGIEFHLVKEEEKIKEFIIRMESLGFCSAQKVLPVLEIVKPKKIKSNNLNYRRTLSHFKLNLKGNKNVESKVYIQVIPNYTSIFGF